MSKNRKIIQQKFEYYFKISVFCLILSFFILAVPLSLVIMFCSMFMALKYSVSKKQLITSLVLYYCSWFLCLIMLIHTEDSLIYNILLSLFVSIVPTLILYFKSKKNINKACFKNSSNEKLINNKRFFIYISMILILINIVVNIFNYIKCVNEYEYCQTFSDDGREIRESLGICPQYCSLAHTSSIYDFLINNSLLIIGAIILVISYGFSGKNSFSEDKYDNLKKLKELYDNGAITKNEYLNEKKKILK